MALNPYKTYFYAEIEQIAEAYNADVVEYGPEYVGQHFICMTGDRDTTFSWVLDGAQGGKFTYKLIYNNE